MNLLIAGLVVFFAIHLIPNIGDTRAKLLDRLGEKGYMPLYAMISLAGIVMVAMGRGDADFIAIWTPPMWTRMLTMLFMFISVFLFAAMFLPTNIKRWVHHPMLSFVAAWGLAHLLSNGDLASMIFFGGFFVFSVFKIISLTRRKPPEPFAPVSISKDIVVLILAVLLFAGGLYGHPYVSGGMTLIN